MCARYQQCARYTNTVNPPIARLPVPQERAGSLHDVESLQHQNNELRALLNQYLSSRINDELQIPPTQII